MRRRDFGFVFQSHHLLPGLSCGENVALGLALAGAATADRLRTAGQLLEELGLTDYAHRRPRELSGGEAQRVAVLRAMAHGPRVVFADEPTGSLDRDNTRRVMDVLVNWQQDKSAGPRTLLLATHNVDEAYDRCDHFLVLKHGRLCRGKLLTRRDAPSVETLHRLLHSGEAEPAESTSHERWLLRWLELLHSREAEPDESATSSGVDVFPHSDEHQP